MSSSHQKLWFEDPATFFVTDVTEFLPDGSMTLTRKLNAAFRFSVYFALVVLVLTYDIRVVIIPLFVAASTYFLGQGSLGPTLPDQARRARGSSEAFANSVDSRLDVLASDARDKAQRPTQQNPFGNFLIFDDPERPPAADASTEADVLRESARFFDKNLYRDVGDVFHTAGSDRQFITMPVTSAVNDQTAFAKFCYGSIGSTRKDVVVF